jgi:hypothetical protein
MVLRASSPRITEPVDADSIDEPRQHRVGSTQMLGAGVGQG